MGRWHPPTGKRGFSNKPVIHRYIEEKMERARQAKRIVDLKINHQGGDSWSLTVRYVVDDPTTGTETLIKERLTSTVDREGLEALKQRLEEEYLNAE